MTRRRPSDAPQTTRLERVRSCVKFRNRIMNIEPRAALTATSKAVARATGNGIPLSASAAPFFSSA